MSVSSADTYFFISVADGDTSVLYGVYFSEKQANYRAAHLRRKPHGFQATVVEGTMKRVGNDQIQIRADGQTKVLPVGAAKVLPVGTTGRVGLNDDRIMSGWS